MNTFSVNGNGSDGFGWLYRIFVLLFFYYLGEEIAKQATIGNYIMNDVLIVQLSVDTSASLHFVINLYWFCCWYKNKNLTRFSPALH